MGWIEQQATEAWAPEEEGVYAQAAADFLTVHIKPIPAPVPSYVETGGPERQTQWFQTTGPTSTTTAGQSSGQAPGYGRGHERYMGEPSTSLNERVQKKRQRTSAIRERREDVGS